MTKKHWSPQEIACLRAIYPHRPTRELAELLGRSMRSVYDQAHQIDLKKTPEFLASGQAGRFDGVRGGAMRFKKGHAPFNKGLRRPEGWAPGNMAKTQFKSGQMPHNTFQVGEYRVVDGYLQQKISTEKGNSSKRWRGVHELVWTAVNGPLPPDHIVVFKLGMRTTELARITIDTVECISRADNMRRNTRHNLPRELNEVIGLRAALVRKINHRTKKNEQREHQ